LITLSPRKQKSVHRERSELGFASSATSRKPRETESKRTTGQKARGRAKDGTRKCRSVTDTSPVEALRNKTHVLLVRKDKNHLRVTASDPIAARIKQRVEWTGFSTQRRFLERFTMNLMVVMAMRIERAKAPSETSTAGSPARMHKKLSDPTPKCGLANREQQSARPKFARTPSLPKFVRRAAFCCGGRVERGVRSCAR
jgi:hypothetical protein